MEHPQQDQINPAEQRLRRLGPDVILMSGLLVFLLGFVIFHFLA